MKEKVIEVVGKTWRFLGQNGEASVVALPKAMKEKGELVLQALGWLAREDKINYSVKNRRSFVSLVESELRAFNNVMYHMDQGIKSNGDTRAPQRRIKARK